MTLRTHGEGPRDESPTEMKTGARLVPDSRTCANPFSLRGPVRGAAKASVALDITMAQATKRGKTSLAGQLAWRT